MPDRFRDLVRPASRILLLSGLFGVAWKLRDDLSLFLRQDSGEGLVPALARNLELVPVVSWGALFAAAGTALALVLAFAAARLRSRPLEHVIAPVAGAFVVLYVPLALVAACLGSLAVSPVFPYGVDLVVTLVMEGSFFVLLTAGLLLAALAHRLAEGGSLPIPPGVQRRLFGPGIVLAALAIFLAVTPARFYREGAGQGNMFKYLRMASAAAGAGSLDIARARANPDVTPSEFLAHLPGLARSYARETARLVGGVLRAASEGRLYRGELTATRANRSMFRTAEGGVYYINAPGPGLALVPAYLVDRRLNAWLGTERQVAVLLFWQLLGALLVHQIALAAAEVAGRPAALLVAFGVGLSVPVLFYTFQIYPELPGGLALVFAFRKLVLDSAPSRMGVLAAGLALGFAPWLHQKYSVVAAVLGLYGAYRLLRRTPGGLVRPRVAVVLLLAPMAVSAYTIFLYNHALTGSLSPTATFTAAGRSAFEPWSFPKGLLGLLFDRENGLFVFAPFYLLAPAGFRAFARAERRLVGPFVLVVASYLFVIASFPYWPGAVSTMGRYILSVLPLLALPAALTLRRATVDGRVAGVAVVLAAASFAFSAGFVRDLIPSYQPVLLWDRSLYSDPYQYLPSFLSEGYLGSGRAHAVKVLAALLLAGAIVYGLRVRARNGERLHDAQPSRFPRRMAAGAGTLLAAVVALGAVLEHWPGNGTRAEKPRHRDTLALPSGVRASVHGAHGFEGEGFWVPGAGESELLVLSRKPLGALSLSFTNGPEPNRVVVRERGVAPMRMDLPPGGPHRRSVLVRKPYRYEGPRGERFVYRLTVESEGSFVPASEDRRSLGTYVGVR